jgi:N-acetyl-gamma-glutamylphosphate reductase
MLENKNYFTIPKLHQKISSRDHDQVISQAGSLIADHAVVSNQTNSQPNVIAAVDNLIKGVTNVTIQGFVTNKEP